MKRSSALTIAFYAVLWVSACSRGGGDAANQNPVGMEDHPPVLINAESPVEYPVALFERKIEADVVLRLFVNADGVVEPESTSVAESSGHPALDSAALAGVSRFRFAPAIQGGKPTATAFLQPIHFRHPEGAEGDNL